MITVLYIFNYVNFTFNFMQFAERVFCSEGICHHPLWLSSIQSCTVSHWEYHRVANQACSRLTPASDGHSKVGVKSTVQLHCKINSIIIIITFLRYIIPFFDGLTSNLTVKLP